MHNSTARYTATGGLDVEMRIGRDQQLVSEALQKSSFAGLIAGVVMIGGYARGEGGYWRDPEGPRAYNDYDYFVVLRDRARVNLASIRDELSEIANKLDRLVKVEVDFFPLLSTDIKGLPFTLMYAEMQSGHRVIMGRENVLQHMPHMPLDALPLSEFQRLLLNRGALLLLNQKALEAGEELDLDLFNRYINKAILACGDSVLYRNQAYDLSYKEKGKRLARLDLDPCLEQLYLRAVEHKFEPQSARLDERSLFALQQTAEQVWTKEFELVRRLVQSEPPSLVYRLRSLAVNLRDDGIRRVLRHPKKAFHYPREQLYQQLPILLRGDISAEDRAERLSEFFGLWARYS